MPFEDCVSRLIPQLRAWQEHLHRSPELSFEEFETTAYLEAILSGMPGVSVSRPTRTGLVAHIRGEKPGRQAVLGVRADIDALPIQEESGLPYASARPGVMHACGHDGHTAMLLGLAKLLSARRASFSGEARLFFQHAEELPPGGAVELVRAGAADGVDAMLGLHLSTNWPTGVFGVRAGVLTAAVDRFDITIKGKGAHCSFPEQGVDVIVTAAQLILALQTISARRVAATAPVIVSICQANAGTAYNILPDEMKLTGAVRSFDPAVRERIKTLIGEITAGVAASAGASYDYVWDAGYASVYNDAALAAAAEQTLLARFGKAHIDHIGPIMPGEDFYAFLDGRPGFFVELGSRCPEKGCDMPHHNPKYRLDQDALPYGVQYLYDMALTLLNKPEKTGE